MDDQQRNVIDGTARARQWTRSRPKPGADAEGTETRSDAPKSIASSLLVPADMVPAGTPPTAGEKPFTTDEHSRAAQTVDRGSVTPDDPLSEGPDHRNPFLTPERAGTGNDGQSVQPSRRRSARALITRLTGGMRARRNSGRTSQNLLAATPRRRPRVLHLTRPVALALGSLAAIALATVILTHQSHMLAQSSRGGESASSLNPFKSGPFPAAAKPVAPRHPARRTGATHARRARAHHRASNKHPRTQPASSTAAVPARYTTPPPTAGSSAAASDSSSYASSDSAAAPAAPPAAQPSSAGNATPPSAGSATPSSAASTTNTPVRAFGSSGALGPGSSPNG